MDTQNTEQGEEFISSCIEEFKQIEFANINNLIACGTEATPALIQLLLESEDLAIQGIAAYALNQIGVNTLPYLIPALLDPNPNIRDASLAVLRSIRTDNLNEISDPNIILALTQVVNDTEFYSFYPINAIVLTELVTKNDAVDPALMIQALQSVDSAIDVLKTIGTISPEFTSALLQIFAHPDHMIRWDGVKVLRELELPDQEGISILIQVIREDPDSEVRERAIEALQEMGWEKIGSQSEDVVSAFIQAIKDDPDSGVRGRVIYTLKEMGLEKIGSQSENLVSAFIQAITDNQDPYVRTSAIDALKEMGWEKIGSQSEDVVSTFIQAITDDPGIDVRNCVVDALKEMGWEKIGSQSEDVVSAFIQTIKDNQDLYVRTSAIEALGNIGSAASSAIPDLVEFLNDEEARVCCAASFALAGISLEGFNKFIEFGKTHDLSECVHPINPEALNYAIPGLKHEDPHIRILSAYAIAMMGEQGGEAVPALISLLQDREVRLFATYALGNIGRGSVDAIPALIQILEEPQDQEDPYQYQAALFALTKMGSEASPAVPVLRKLLQYQNLPEDIRWQIFDTLLCIGSGSAAAIPELKQEIEPREDNTFSSFSSIAISILEEIGAEAVDAVPTIIQYLALNDYNNNIIAIKALGKIGQPVDQIVPAIAATLKDESFLASVTFQPNYTGFTIDVQRSEPSIVVGQALSNIGSTALSIMTEILQEGNSSQRCQIVYALICHYLVRYIEIVQKLEEEGYTVQRLEDKDIAPFISILHHFLEDSDIGLRRSAAIALGIMSSKFIIVFIDYAAPYTEVVKAVQDALKKLTNSN